MSSLRLRASIALLALFSLPLVAADYTTSAVVRPHVASPLTTGVNLTYSRQFLKNYQSPPGVSPVTTGQSLNLEVEWLPFADLVGKPALGMSFGYAQMPLREVKNLHLFPVGMFLSYRFDYLTRQWLVPYIKGGASGVFYQPGSGGRTQVAWNWDYGGGLAISLGAIDTYSVRHLDASTGINDFFLTVEYVKSVPLRQGQSADLSHEEFRFGIRLEI